MSPRLRGALAQIAVAGVAAATTAGVLRQPATRSGRWQRVNYRGATVSLWEGPAVVSGTAVGLLATTLAARQRRAAVAGAAAVVLAGIVGVADDLLGGEGPSAQVKGLHGHFRALRRGRVTTGVVKVAGLGLAGLLAAADQRGRPWWQRLAGAALVAGSGNLVNLLDLRPGRALKVSLGVGTAVAVATGQPSAAASVGAALSAWPTDLGERTMLGDAGASALGVGLGVALAPRRARSVLAALAVAVTATLVSERVSFSDVIDTTPWLRALDHAGRPAEVRAAAPDRSTAA